MGTTSEKMSGPAQLPLSPSRVYHSAQIADEVSAETNLLEHRYATYFLTWVD